MANEGTRVFGFIFTMILVLGVGGLVIWGLVKLGEKNPPMIIVKEWAIQQYIFSQCVC